MYLSCLIKFSISDCLPRHVYRIVQCFTLKQQVGIVLHRACYMLSLPFGDLLLRWWSCAERTSSLYWDICSLLHSTLLPLPSQFIVLIVNLVYNTSFSKAYSTKIQKIIFQLWNRLTFYPRLISYSIVNSTKNIKA